MKGNNRVKSLLLVLLTVTTLALGFTASAGAHNRVTFYWSSGLAEHQLVEDGVEWAEGFEYVDSARCRGFGPFTRSKKSGRRLFKHFRCSVVTTSEKTGDQDSYRLTLHVLGRYRWEARA